MPKGIKVLITGGTGYIASLLLPTFRERFDLLLVDHRAQNRQGERVEGVVVADLDDPDRRKYAAHFEGVDAVVHLGLKRLSPSGTSNIPLADSGLKGDDPIDDDFSSQSANVGMAYNVLRTAYDAGVRRVAFASSHGAGGWHMNLIRQRKLEMIDPYMLPISDSFYGWAKAATEHMGFLFACGAFGRKMGVVNVRIGWPHEPDVKEFSGDPAGYKLRLGSHISARDLTQLFMKAVEAPDIDNEEGVPWQVVYGYSGNIRAYASLVNARRVLDYQPEDDTEVKYARDIRGFIAGEGATGGVGRLGI